MAQTPCKDCAFALYKNTEAPDETHTEYNEDGTTPQQIGCELGMIERFKEAGVEVIEAFDEKHEFYVIGRKCLYGRSKNWKQENIGIDFLKVIRSEIAIKVEVIIYVDENNAWEDIEETVESIQKQTLQPVKIVFVQHPSCKFKASSYNVHFNQMFIPWRMEFVVESDSSDGGYGKIVDRNRCIDLAVKKVQSSNIIIVDAGTALSENYLKRIDELINDDLQQILVIEPDDDQSGLFVRKAFFTQIGGNRMKPFVDKVDTLLKKDEECQKFALQSSCL